MIKPARSKDMHLEAARLESPNSSRRVRFRFTLRMLALTRRFTAATSSRILNAVSRARSAAISALVEFRTSAVSWSKRLIEFCIPQVPTDRLRVSFSNRAYDRLLHVRSLSMVALTLCLVVVVPLGFVVACGFQRSASVEEVLIYRDIDMAALFIPLFPIHT